MNKNILFAVLLLPLSAQAVDSMSLEAGYGNKHVYPVRVGAQWDWQRKWFTEGRWRLGGYWDLSAGAWEGARETVVDLSLTPTFRFERTEGGSPYLEAAIGFHWLSNVHVARERDFSSHFQFGDHVGAGFRFGSRNSYDLSLRLQHLSNAGIRSPNPGINFLQLRLLVHFKD